MVMRGTRSEGGIADGDSGVVKGGGVWFSDGEGMETGAMGAQPSKANNIKADANK